MIRILEILLFLAPFAMFAAWRLLTPNAELGPRQLTMAGVVLAVFIALLVWLRMEDAEPADRAYVPARLQDGIVTEPASRP
jgi:hypothetical protein